MFLARMEQLPMSFEHTYLTLRKTQRVARVLRALVDYVQIYKPRMDGQVPQDLIPITTDGLLRGAFVCNTTTLQRFHQARIPVWCLCPLMEAVLYCVDALANVLSSDGRIVLANPRLKLHSIYTSPPNSNK